MFKHYTMNQVALPLDLERKLQEYDIAYAVNDIVEGISDEAFAGFLCETGCPAYHPRMMMKIILCAYTQSVFSGRKIEGLLQVSVRMMWPCPRVRAKLSYHQSLSYSSISQRIAAPVLYPIPMSTRTRKLIDEEAIFIDGTKIEANANKFTFVWRKAIEKYSANLVEKSKQLYEVLLENKIIPEIERESPDEMSVEELSKVVEKLDENIEEYDKKIEANEDVNERKKMRSLRKAPKYRKQFKDLLERK